MVSSRNATPLPSSSDSSTSRLIFPLVGVQLWNARIAGLWEWERVWSHINKKELQTCFIAPEYFVLHLRDIHVQLSVDNTAAVSYVYHSGGGGGKVPGFVRSGNCNLGVMLTKKDFSFSNSHTRYCKQNPRWSVSSKARKHGKDVRFQCFLSDSS